MKRQTSDAHAQRSVGFVLTSRSDSSERSSRLSRPLAVDHNGEHNAVDELVEVTILFTRFHAEDRAVFVDPVVVDRGSASDVIEV